MYMLRPNLESIQIRILLDWDGHPNLELSPIRIGTSCNWHPNLDLDSFMTVPIRIGMNKAMNSKLGWPSQSSKIRIGIDSELGRNIYMLYCNLESVCMVLK
jgi:hypothetical protein